MYAFTRAMRIVITPLLLATLLAGCQLAPGHRQQDAAWPPADSARLSVWLSHSVNMLELSQDEAKVRLHYIGTEKPEDTFELFNYALLNQQLGTRIGWIRARDSLRMLNAMAPSETLPAEVQLLVTLLLNHNQQMINFEARQSRLQGQLTELEAQQALTAEELEQSRQEALLLSRKIDALTRLENSMSIRRNLEQENIAIPVPEGEEPAPNDSEGQGAPAD